MLQDQEIQAWWARLDAGVQPEQICQKVKNAKLTSSMLNGGDSYTSSIWEELFLQEFMNHDTEKAKKERQVNDF